MTENQIVPIEGAVNQMVEISTVKINMSIVPRKFKEVMDEIAPQGEPRKVRDLVDQPVTILGIRFFSGKYGIAAFVIGATKEGELFNTVIGQKVVLPKLALIKEQLPVEVTFVKREGGQNEGYYDVE